MTPACFVHCSRQTLCFIYTHVCDWRATYYIITQWHNQCDSHILIASTPSLYGSCKSSSSALIRTTDAHCTSGILYVVYLQVVEDELYDASLRRSSIGRHGKVCLFDRRHTTGCGLFGQAIVQVFWDEMTSVLFC